MTCEALRGLEPARAFEIFSELCRIPHGSKNEAAISDWIRGFCERLGLETWQDEVKNLIVRKPATPGYEDAPICVLQAHMDMVCEKNADVEHDFTKDPIHVLRDGDRVHADGTTLGADDCLGVAFALAVMESKALKHPALEMVLTVDEEAGMSGINHIDFSKIHGRVIINLDCSDEGIVTGCAGTALMGLRRDMAREAVDRSANDCWRLSIGGMKGGHSGLDARKERGNANQILARVLSGLSEPALRLVSIRGGAQTNAITRAGEAVFVAPKADADRLRAAFETLSAAVRREHAISDPDTWLSLEAAPECPDGAFAAADTDALITLLLAVPSGLIHMNLEVPELPELSGNIGIVDTEGDSVVVKILYRSCYGSRKREIMDICARVARALGARVESAYDTPEWEYKADSRLTALIRRVHKAQTGRDILVEVSHGGNECGTFFRQFPDADIVCTGTKITGAHSPEESFLVSNAQKEWNQLVGTLEGMLEY